MLTNNFDQNFVTNESIRELLKVILINQRATFLYFELNHID